MPSPVGHALGAVAASLWLWRRPPCPDQPAGHHQVGPADATGGPSRHGAATGIWPAPIVALAVIGMLPDIDLLVHAHRGPAHSIGAALMVAVVAWGVTRQPRWGAAAALAWTSHVVLDWLGEDTRPPIGIEALWPFSDGFFQAPFVIFPSVSRRYWLPEFWVDNLKRSPLSW